MIVMFKDQYATHNASDSKYLKFAEKASILQGNRILP